MKETLMSQHSVLTVVGKNRIGIVYEVAKILAENRLNIVNISQQLMDDYFTMIILLGTEQCPKSREDIMALMAAEGQKLGLDMRLLDEALFNAMHRV